MSRTEDNRDWTKTGTVASMADWLRKKSGALAVIVVRVEDAVLSADAEIAPSDVERVVADKLLLLTKNLAAARLKKKHAARLDLGPLGE